MRNSNWTPSIVPSSDDQDVCMVVNDFGARPLAGRSERVAQTVEHVTFNHGVVGSSPTALTKKSS